MTETAILIAVVAAACGWLVRYTQGSANPVWPDPSKMPFWELRSIYFRRCEDEGHDYMGRGGR